MTGDLLSKNIQRHLECMLGIQHVIAPAIHSVSLCHHDVQPHIVEHCRGDGGRGMEKNDGFGDQKVQYM